MCCGSLSQRRLLDKYFPHMKKMSDTVLASRGNAIVSLNVITEQETVLPTVPRDVTRITKLRVSSANRYLLVTMQVANSYINLIVDLYEPLKRFILYTRSSPVTFRGNYIHISTSSDNIMIYNINTKALSAVVRPLGWVQKVTCDGSYAYYTHNWEGHISLNSKTVTMFYRDDLLQSTPRVLDAIRRHIMPLEPHSIEILGNKIVVVKNEGIVEIYGLNGIDLIVSRSIGSRDFIGEVKNGYVILTQNTFHITDRNLNVRTSLGPLQNVLPLHPEPTHYLTLSPYIIPELLTEIDRYLREDC